MKRKLITLAVAAAMSGCSAPQIVSTAVTKYCDMPLEARAANREAVALAVAPNRIEIKCYE